MHRLWLTLSLPKAVMEVNHVISILFLVWLLAFKMPPISIGTDCHNLVPKKNKKKNLFLNHFRIVWNLSRSELTRRNQTVVNHSIEIVFPIKWIQWNRSESSFLGWWGYSQIKVMGVFNGCLEALEGTKVLFCGRGSKLLLLLRVLQDSLLSHKSTT